jgi:nitrogen fixation/metabolism regulation signal transduction histidine kinase
MVEAADKGKDAGERGGKPEAGTDEPPPKGGTARAEPAGRERRRLRNLLLDRHFQLKYTGFLTGVAAILSITLGFLLWRTEQSLVTQSRKTVEQGQQVVALGRKVADESRKVSAVVEMNIVKDPVYADNPELLDAFKTDSAQQAARIAQQQSALEQHAAALTHQSAALESGQDTLFATLCSVLAALVVALALVGIVVTHKVAGPVYKMTRQIRELGEGSLRMPAPLRKGDELGSFFDTFASTVQSLRERREKEIAALDAAIAQLGGKVEPADVAPLEELRTALGRGL